MGNFLSHKVCQNSDLGIVKSIRHVVMQCPSNETEKRDMFEELGDIEDGSAVFAMENRENILNMILGSNVNGLSDEQMFTLWEITGMAVNKI